MNRITDMLYWTASGGLLAIGLAGHHQGYDLALVLAAIHVLHSAAAEGDLHARPVVARLGYLLLIALCRLAPLAFWIPVIGLVCTAVPALGQRLAAAMSRRMRRISWPAGREMMRI